jgi:hypothetical protein
MQTAAKRAMPKRQGATGRVARRVWIVSMRGDKTQQSTNNVLFHLLLLVKYTAEATGISRKNKGSMGDSKRLVSQHLSYH